MKQPNGFTSIGLSAIRIGLGRSQLAFINSATASSLQGPMTKKYICERVGLHSNHYARFVNELSKYSKTIGEYQYSQESRKVIKPYILFRKDQKEQFIKIPSILIQKKQLSNHDLKVLMALTIFTFKNQESWTSSVFKFVKITNQLFEKKEWNISLDLASTYKSLKRLKTLNLVSYKKVSILANKKVKYFINYISNIKLTDKFWNIANIKLPPPTYYSPPTSQKSKDKPIIKSQEKTENNSVDMEEYEAKLKELGW